MGNPTVQLNIANLLPTIESAQFFGNRLKQLNISLLVETVLVSFTVILAIRVLTVGFLAGIAWLAVPAVLVSAAIVRTVIKRGNFSEIGLNIRQIRYSFVLLGWTCVVVFPAMFFSLCLLNSYGLELPLRPVLPEGQSWFCWLFYQFMYVAVAEEVFFRGYVQGNILRLTNTVRGDESGLTQWISIVISAAVFAVAHIIVQAQTISVLTFLPGLIIGWLFIRTRSLLAPILFHGLANIYYFSITAMFA